MSKEIIAFGIMLSIGIIFFIVLAMILTILIGKQLNVLLKN